MTDILLYTPGHKRSLSDLMNVQSPANGAAEDLSHPVLDYTLDAGCSGKVRSSWRREVL
jgi:hypothetical protein